MDLVTITDHDSIGGCLEFLERHPDARDFFVSEEVSCWFPEADLQVHFGVYGMTERLHAELQPLRRNVFDVAARLREAGVFFVLNHLLHFYRRQVSLPTYLRLLDEVPGVEARNGTMIAAHNQLVERLADEWSPAVPLARVGGSDAHTLRRVGRTWTEAPATGVESFLASLRERRSGTAGVHGGTASVAADAYGVVWRYAASLVGFGPQDHAPLHRAGCLAFSIVSLPAQILPLAIVASGKRRESEIVRSVVAEIEREPAVATPVCT
jgi:predicted metal-dependent phosphoesterase TrpH